MKGNICSWLSFFQLVFFWLSPLRVVLMYIFHEHCKTIFRTLPGAWLCCSNPLPPAAFRVILLTKIKIDIIKYVDVFNDPTSVWWEKYLFWNNNKYYNILYCTKIKYGQIVPVVILAMSSRWLDETMWF